MSSTEVVTSYVPLPNLRFKLAVPFSSVILVYVTPLIVMFTDLFVKGLPLASVTFTINLSGPLKYFSTSGALIITSLLIGLHILEPLMKMVLSVWLLT